MYTGQALVGQNMKARNRRGTPNGKSYTAIDLRYPPAPLNSHPPPTVARRGAAAILRMNFLACISFLLMAVGLGFFNRFQAKITTTNSRIQIL